MRIRTELLFLFLALAAALAQQTESGVMVPMRDGVRLATDIYRPAGDDRFPVIVTRTPYNKASLKGAGEFFARHGYVVLMQDVRGRFASEGSFYPFVNEGKDGYDTIEWAAAQPWSNGKIGTAGGSYLAWDQYCAAMYRPPHLAVMFALVGGANFLEEFGHPGGTPNLGWPRWMLSQASTSGDAARNPAAKQALVDTMRQPGTWLAEDPRKRASLFDSEPEFHKLYEDFYAHTELDSYWKQRGFYTEGYYKDMKDVPTYFLSGWYDYFLEGVLKNFAALSKMQNSDKRLMVGPWPHGLGAADCGDVNFGSAAHKDLNALELDWFDHWLKGKPFALVGDEKVLLFRMGGGDGSRTPGGRKVHAGEWLPATAWPPPDVRPAKYYLHSEGRLTRTVPGGEKPSRFVYDPEHPVPTIGGRYSNCAQDQSPLSGRPDVLPFETEPLDEPVEVTGKVWAKLWISSDAVDTDFTAKLVDVYPDGYALIITDGQLRARYRGGHAKPRLMKPETVYGISIDVGSTSNLFARGHRIRVEISSSNYPKFDPNPNTGEPAGAWTHRVRAKNTIYHDAAHASLVELPERQSSAPSSGQR